MLKGSILYAAAGLDGFRIVDVGNPAHPQVLFEQTLLDRTRGIAYYELWGDHDDDPQTPDEVTNKRVVLVGGGVDVGVRLGIVPLAGRVLESPVEVAGVVNDDAPPPVPLADGVKLRRDHDGTVQGAFVS